MSRKHYVMLARSIHERLVLRSQAQLSEIRLYVEDVADGLQADNPNFNRERFITAALEGK